MNRKTLFKNLALSSLLVSAIAVPSVSAASNSPQEKELEGHIKATATAVAVSFESKLAPLELVKTYAPETLKEWDRTLEKYGKLVGATAPVAATASISVEKEGSGEEMNSIQGTDYGKETIPAVEITVAAVAVDSNEQMGDTVSAFDKAHTALYDPAETKDAAAIKKALDHLLEQYKKQIAEIENAK